MSYLIMSEQVMPKISIIVPVHNAAGLISRCIDSVLAQTFDEWELLIVNDNSSDDTCSIISSYDEPRMQLCVSAGSGVSAARNTGLDKSRGQYVFFLDADDMLDSECLSELYALSEGSKADISQCSFFFLYENGSRIKDREAVSGEFSGHEEIMREYFSGMIGGINLASWGKLYRRQLIDNIRFDETLTVQEDAFFTFQCCIKADRVICSDEPRYFYCQNPMSVMNRRFDGSKMQYFTVLDRELGVCKDNESLATRIKIRKITTALDLTGNIIREDSGREYLEHLREIALKTSDEIGTDKMTDRRLRSKVFLLRHFPSVYYGLLKIKR